MLPGVAISVGMTMFPDGYIGVRPVTMAGIIIGLYCGCVIAGQTALMLPAAALVIDFLFVLLIMALTCEPTMYKPAISFLLCFVFAQSTPVPPAAFPMRLAGAAAGNSLEAQMEHGEVHDGAESEKLSGSGGQQRGHHSADQ